MKTLQNISGGERFEDICCILKNFYNSKDAYDLILQSKEISKKAFMRSNLFTFEQMKSFKGKAVIISGYCEPALDGLIEEKIKVKDIRLAPVSVPNEEKGEAQQENPILELMLKIDPKVLEGYLSRIKEYVQYVRNVSYRYLLYYYFSKDNIGKMMSMPATHVRQGSPGGGMLHATAAVTDIAYTMAFRYMSNANGIFSFNDKMCFDWDLLITAGLMHLSGNLYYFESEPPHNKRSSGVEQGYSTCRQRYILDLIKEHEIEISEEDLSALFGVMAKLNEQQEGIKKCRQEASFLTAAYKTFLEMDSFDAEIRNILVKKSEGSGIEDDYLFSNNLDCYVSKAEIERKIQLLGLAPAKEEGKGGDE